MNVTKQDPIKVNRQTIALAINNYLELTRYVETPATRIPEGSWVKVGNELARFEGTDPENPNKWRIVYAYAKERDSLSKGAFTSFQMVHPEDQARVTYEIRVIDGMARDFLSEFVGGYANRTHECSCRGEVPGCGCRP